jgi:hypothetical protein
MRLFKIGDRVKIGDVVGDVIENHYWWLELELLKTKIIS